MRELRDLSPEEFAQLQGILFVSPKAKAVIWAIWGICVALTAIGLCYVYFRG